MLCKIRQHIQLCTFSNRGSVVWSYVIQGEQFSQATILLKLCCGIVQHEPVNMVR